jgi:hypothetical protein
VNDDASANDAKADLFLGEHRSVADADHNPLPRQLRCRLSQTLFMFIGREWNREKIIVVHFFNNKLINKQKKEETKLCSSMGAHAQPPIIRKESRNQRIN